MKNARALKGVLVALLLLTAGVSTQISAAPETEEKAGPQMIKGQHLWRIFGRLTPEEQSEALRLERESPEKFQQFLREKGEQMFKAMRLKMKEHRELRKEYASATAERQQEIRKQLEDSVKADFLKQLDNRKAALEASKRRLAEQETRLEQQFADQDKIVSQIVEDIISGKMPKKGSRGPRRPGDERRKNMSETPAVQAAEEK